MDLGCSGFLEGMELNRRKYLMSLVRGGVSGFKA